MLFNSFHYFIFLPLVVLACFAMPFRHRWWLLLIGSYYFYMCWKWQYASLMAAVSLLNYVCGLAIAKAGTPGRRRLSLVTALAGSLGLLFYFKYFNFANDSLRTAAEWLSLSYPVPHLDILLPVGISFFTFQALSYSIDVYRGQCPVEPHLGRFFLFISFFPQLVAGPIERSTNLLPQFLREHRFDVARLSSGLKLVLWGLFKKVVIADRLADYVARVYGQPELYSGGTLALATYFFAFQIYCDFSGYSDIAIGSARILGYDLMQNFKLPYLAKSISEFWQRWHISLSTWFRDYVYIPLGGSRVSAGRWVFNILVVFLVSGLWHGANWTFIIWGGLHGTYYLLERFAGPGAGRVCSALRLPSWLVSLLQVILTFHLVLIAWVFFRARNLGDALLILTRMASDLNGSLYWGPSSVTTLLCIVLILFLMVVQVLQYRERLPLYFSSAAVPLPVRWCGYVGLLLGIALLGKSGSDFIYFQF